MSNEYTSVIRCQMPEDYVDLNMTFLQMPEEEAFAVMVKVMQEYRLRELFKPSMAELGLCMFQFECMIQVCSSSNHSWQSSDSACSSSSA